MPWTLLLDWRVWLGIALAGALVGVKIQTARLDSAKKDLTALQATYDTFVARVAAEGKAAQERADKQAQADKQRKEKADVENSRTIALLNQRVASLRHDADNRSSYSLPPAAPGSLRPDLACFDRGAFELARGNFVTELRKLADEGTTNALMLETAKAWASNGMLPGILESKTPRP